MKDNGVYVFVLEGKIDSAEEKLEKRDGMGIWEIDEIPLIANDDSQILLIEVPMN